MRNFSKFRPPLARKTSLFENMKDVFTHKWADSDPVIRSFDRKPHCARCGGSHWTVSCPSKAQTLFSGDDALVQMFLIDEGETEPEDQVKLLDRVYDRWRKKDE